MIIVMIILVDGEAKMNAENTIEILMKKTVCNYNRGNDSDNDHNSLILNNNNNNINNLNTSKPKSPETGIGHDDSPKTAIVICYKNRGRRNLRSEINKLISPPFFHSLFFLLPSHIIRATKRNYIRQKE